MAYTVFSENIYKVTVSQNCYGNAIIFIYDILYDVPIKKLVQRQVYNNKALPQSNNIYHENWRFTIGVYLAYQPPVVKHAELRRRRRW